MKGYVSCRAGRCPGSLARPESRYPGLAAETGPPEKQRKWT